MKNIHTTIQTDLFIQSHNVHTDHQTSITDNIRTRYLGIEALQSEDVDFLQTYDVSQSYKNKLLQNYAVARFSSVSAGRLLKNVLGQSLFNQMHCAFPPRTRDETSRNCRIAELERLLPDTLLVLRFVLAIITHEEKLITKVYDNEQR